MILPLPEAFQKESFSFTLKPLLIGGKAMEHYGLRAGNDYDLLIPNQEFQRLRQHFPYGFFTNPYGDAGIQVGKYEFYTSQFGFIYFQLERGSVDQDNYLVVHLEILLFLKTLTQVYDPANLKVRHDIISLMNKLGVHPFSSETNTYSDDHK